MTGDGPLRGVVAISSGTGGVRGYVGSPMLGDISLKDAVGKGSVQIVKNHPDWPRPYNGITAIRHGDIDRDIGTSHDIMYRRLLRHRAADSQLDFHLFLQAFIWQRVSNDRVSWRPQHLSLASSARRRVGI
jgi:hypothetical protein